MWAFEVESCCLAFQRGGVTGLPQVVFSEFPWGPRRNCAGKGSAGIGPKRLTSGQISEFSPGLH